MNHVYRIIWSDASATFIAVAETAGSHGKRSLGKRVRTLRALALAASMFAGANAVADPTGGQVSAGTGRIEQRGAITTITQATPKMAINWQGFNIAAGETVNFVQPGASAVALNRVLGTDGTHILGQLNANGQVYVLNPNGVLFGKGAQVSVGALVASTLQMSDSDFMAGKLTFAGAGGTVTNEGSITANGGGYVSLLGGQVSNNGTITAKMGTVALGAGQQVTLDFSGDGLLKMTVDKGLADALSDNRGLIQADGGSVIMAAQTADVLRASVVNNDGVIQARSLENRDGVIRLSGTQIRNAGKLDASGTEGANGGRIEVNAGYAMLNSGSLNASGANGGVISVTTHNLIEAGQYDASGTAQGGSISLAAANHIEQTVASMLKAEGGAAQGGAIRIEAKGDAWLSGSAAANGRTGGEIAVTAPDLVMAGAKLAATGQQGGGRIRIGGGWQGSDTDLANAARTRLVDTHVDVSATDHGHGGTAVVWSDNSTLFGGQIKARGGALGGDGGKVEVSSHGQLGFGGTVDAAAPEGRNGQLLLDPKNIEIVDSVTGLMILPLTGFTASADAQFGAGSIVEVPASNGILIASPNENYNTAGEKSGAVRLFNKNTGALKSVLQGGSAGDQVGSGGIVSLGNGNYVLSSPFWTSVLLYTKTANVGAVTWLGQASSLPESIYDKNSLVGSSANDQVGSGGIVVSPVGDYLVRSPQWNYVNPSSGTPTAQVGAVTLASGSNGKFGAVSTGVSGNLFGSSKDDRVGSGDVKFLSSQAFVVASPLWDYATGTTTDAGAVTYMSINANPAQVDAGNSLFGTTSGDQVGSGGITVLPNGNYLVSSPDWGIPNGKEKLGAVTFGSGTSGVKGIIDNSANTGNSMIGVTAGDRISSGGIKILTSNNYVVLSPEWGNTTQNPNAGAVTWGSSTTTLSGAVSATNSLTGTRTGDQVGSGGVTPLGSVNYVVSSPHWALSSTSSNVGAVTWGSGTAGVKGAISLSNSLLGSTSGDQVGSGGVTPLGSGNYVVSSPHWALSSTSSNVGAVTWGSGTAGVKGAISNNVSSGNSLTGSSSGDQIGSRGVTNLPSGNYVVVSPNWSNANANATTASAGAVTWASGTALSRGTISSTNSLYGSSPNDHVGSGGITVLDGGDYKGYYVVSSPEWSATTGESSSARIGAVTLISPQGGLPNTISTGAAVLGGGVTSANSFTGSKTDDAVGSGGITPLPSGNFVVSSPNWHNGTISGAGAVSWIQSGAEVGVVSVANSLLGTTENDNIGSGTIRALSDGRVLVASPLWDAPGAVNAGRVDIISPALGLSNDNFSFASYPSVTSTLQTAALASQLLQQSDVTLQANNDITLWNALSVANLTGGSSGTLIMQAGRSINLNANIYMPNGSLTLMANAAAQTGSTTGAISVDRDAGKAVIAMATGTSIRARNITLSLTDGQGLTNRESGDISLGKIDGINIVAINNGITAGSGIVLNDTLSATGSGNSIVLAGKVFTNKTKANSLVTTASGYWRVWSDAPDADDRSGLAYNFKQYNVRYGAATEGTGKGFLYSVAPVITPQLIETTSKIYDGKLDAVLTDKNFRITGTIDNDSVKLSSTATATYSGADVGNTNVKVTGLSVTSVDSSGLPVYGYGFPVTEANANIGNILPFKVQLAGTRAYDGSTTIDTGILAMNALPLGQTLNLSGAPSVGNPTLVGTYHYIKNVNLESNANPALGNAANYALDDGNHNIIITRAPLTLSSNPAYSKTYDGGTSAPLNFVVPLNGTTPANNERVDGGTFVFTDPNKGINNKEVIIGDVKVINNINGIDRSSNYDITYINNKTSTINPFAVKLSGGRTYDGTTNAPALSMNALPNNETLSLSAGPGTIASRNVGTYTNVTGISLVSNPVLAQGNADNYILADNAHAITINAASLAVSTSAVTKTYDGNFSADGKLLVTGTVFDGDAIDASKASYLFTDKDAGTFKTVTTSGITVADGNGGKNYKITPVDNVDSIINRHAVSLTGNRVYDGTNEAPATLAMGLLPNNETLSLSGSGTLNGKDVGTYAAVTGLQLADATDGSNGKEKNYFLDDGKHALSITQAPLTVSNNVPGKIYDGTIQAFGGNVIEAGDTNLVRNDVFSGGTFAFGKKDVGPGNYVMTAGVTILDAAGIDMTRNYAITYRDNVASKITPYAVSLSGTRLYDGTATVDAGIFTMGKLVGNETLGLAGIGSVAGKNAGPIAQMVDVTGLALTDGSNGGLASNYMFAAGIQTATINPAPLTLSTSSVNKTYDGTTAAAGTSIAVKGTQLYGSDTLSGGSYYFEDRNAGTGKTVSVNDVNVSDGNGGANYAVSYVNNASSSIAAAPLTLSTINVGKPYDGTVAAAGSPIVTSGTLFSGDSLSGGSYAFTDPNIGTGKTVTASDIVINDGNGGANYSISYVSNTGSSITSSPQSEGASQQAGAVVATATAEQARLGADRPLPQWNSTRATWCLLPSSKCAVQPDLPLFVNAGGLRLPEGIVAK
jgi:filamentous hemagglutinin family protein